MFAARVKSYYAAAGGDGAGKKVKEVVGVPARATCGRPAAFSSPCAPLLANLKKTHSCGAGLHVPVPVLATEGSALSKRPRKSRSVGDLTHYTRHFTKCRRSGVPAPMNRGGEVGSRGSAPGAWVAEPQGASTDTCEARRAFQLMMLNAWRRRREETRALQTRVEQMRLQVTALRTLNKQEGDRAVRAHQDASRARGQSDALRLQLEALRLEKETLTAANASLEGRLSEQLTAGENLRNELQAARQDAAALDAQLAKERAKLAAARQQCAALAEQVEGTEAQLKEAGVQLEAARCDCERMSRSAELAEDELQRATTRCLDLEEALDAERQASQRAREALHDHGQELERTRALLELERTPRRSVCRLLEVLRVPLGLLHAVYVAVCPNSYPTTSGRAPGRAPRAP